MKLNSLLTVAFAASAILITACDKKEEGGGASGGKTGGGTTAVSEKDTVASFKTAVLEVDTLVGEMKGAASPAIMKTKMTEAVAKMKAIKPDGLPADLKEAFLAKKTNTLESFEILKDMPETEAEAQAYFGKIMADPESGAKMKKLKADSESTGKTFKEVCAKHGIELKHASE